MDLSTFLSECIFETNEFMIQYHNSHVGWLESLSKRKMAGRHSRGRIFVPCPSYICLEYVQIIMVQRKKIKEKIGKRLS